MDKFLDALANYVPVILLFSLFSLLSCMNTVQVIFKHWFISRRCTDCLKKHSEAEAEKSETQGVIK